jgi:hypothetical protein
MTKKFSLHYAKNKDWNLFHIKSCIFFEKFISLFLLCSKHLTKSIEQFIKSENQVFKLWIYETLKLFSCILLLKQCNRLWNSPAKTCSNSCHTSYCLPLYYWRKSFLKIQTFLLFKHLNHQPSLCSWSFSSSCRSIWLLLAYFLQATQLIPIYGCVRWNSFCQPLSSPICWLLVF